MIRGNVAHEVLLVQESVDLLEDQIATTIASSGVVIIARRGGGGRSRTSGARNQLAMANVATETWDIFELVIKSGLVLTNVNIKRLFSRKKCKFAYAYHGSLTKFAKSLIRRRQFLEFHTTPLDPSTSSHRVTGSTLKMARLLNRF